MHNVLKVKVSRFRGQTSFLTVKCLYGELPLLKCYLPMGLVASETVKQPKYSEKPALRDSAKVMVFHGRWRRKIVAKKSCSPRTKSLQKNSTAELYMPCIHEQEC